MSTRAKVPNKHGRGVLPSFKLVMLGDPNVGKTSILRRWEDNSFDTTEDVSLPGSKDYVEKTIENNGNPILLSMEDTVGQERFRTLTASFYRGAALVLLVFDLSDSKSFDSVSVWAEDLLRFSGPVDIIIVGNKSDLDRQVTPEEGKEKVESIENAIEYFEVSAKTNENLPDLLNFVVNKVVASRGDSLPQKTDSVKLQLKKPNQTKKRKTCSITQ
eukprot:TRINITY_DN9244_c0_g2_i1.p1 TRINITY_DN9244_c0_g2~~TRINITY_DN9244_c0_g2_i1.p1  ORF type:complete len:216 (+),score=44.08 TRINITY_DN9244_c0_g2_i1:77-724(+)